MRCTVHAGVRQGGGRGGGWVGGGGLGGEDTRKKDMQNARDSEIGS